MKSLDNFPNKLSKAIVFTVSLLLPSRSNVFHGPWNPGTASIADESVYSIESQDRMDHDAHHRAFGSRIGEEDPWPSKERHVHPKRLLIAELKGSK
jgi:hypothetical protein